MFEPCLNQPKTKKTFSCLKVLSNMGGGYRIRTGRLLHAMQAL